MKVTLFMATSVNGYVTGVNDDTDWVKDTEILYQFLADKGACVMGKRTYLESKKFAAFPYQGALNVVLTHDEDLIKQTSEKVIFTSSTPGEVITLLESKGYQELVVMGGGIVNAEFLSAGLIEELVIDVHPIIINQGIQVFENDFPIVNLELISSDKLAHGMVQNKYKVIKL